MLGGQALHDMPRLANTLLQQTKSRLEESRNISREIKEDVVGGLHGLHEMILRLADSRNRHIAEKEKLRASYERRISQLENKHASALHAFLGTHQKLSSELLESVKATHKEAETARWLFLETEQLNKDNAKAIRELADKVPGALCGTDVAAIGTIQEDIAMLRLELGTFTIPACPGSSQHAVDSADTAKTATDIAEIKLELEKLRQDVCAAAPSRSYSEVARAAVKSRATISEDGNTRQLRDQAVMPHFPIMIESVDPRDCGEDIIRKIKKTVDVVELGVGVNSVQKLENQKVLISCDSEKDRTTLGQAIRDSGEILTVSKPTPKNPLIKLLAVAQDLDDRKLEEAIFKQNSNLLRVIEDSNQHRLKVIRRTKARNNVLCNVILETDPQLWRAMVDQKIRLGYQLVRAVDQTPVVQCYNCLGFSHRAAECRSQTKCGHCAGSHDTRKCDNRSGPPKCTNCSTDNNHPAFSQSCPEWQRWDRIARNSVSYC